MKTALAQVSASASISEPRLARSYTKISTNSAAPFDGKARFESISAPHLPLGWPLRPQGERCSAWRQNAQVSRAAHGCSIFLLPFDFSFSAVFLFAASTTYFLPLSLRGERSRSAARHRAQGTVSYAKRVQFGILRHFSVDAGIIRVRYVSDAAEKNRTAAVLDDTPKTFCGLVRVYTARR